MFKSKMKKDVFRVFFITITIVAIVYGVVLIPFEIKRYNDRLKSIEITLNALTKENENDISNQLFLSSLEGLKVSLKNLLRYNQISDVEVFSKDGRFVVSTNELELNNESTINTKLGREGITENRYYKNLHLLSYSSRMTVNGATYGFIKINYSLNELDREAFFSAFIYFAIFLTLILLSIIGVNFFISKMILKPLAVLSDAIEKMKLGNYVEIKEVSINNEIKPLIDSFNKMSLENKNMYEKINEIRNGLEHIVEEQSIEMQQTNKLLETILDNAHDGIIVLENVVDDSDKIIDFKVIVANPKARKDFLNLDISNELLFFSEYDELKNDEIYELLLNVANTGEKKNVEVFKNIYGLTGWYSLAITKLENKLSFVYTDITEKRKMEIDLRYKASVDGLTKLYNRRSFDEIFLIEWKRARREHYFLTLVVIDVDYFKNYNDEYGHQMGDSCLKKIGEVLMKALKRPADIAARYGGEEFILLLPKTDIDGGKIVAENIMEEMRRLHIPNKVSKVSDIVSLSMGIVSITPKDNEQSNDFINSADKLLYKAKENGRNRYEILGR